MNTTFQTELVKLTKQYFEIALAHVDRNSELSDNLRKALFSLPIKEEAELPGYETRPMKFGKFENRIFVVMMTDIRKSTSIINDKNGLVNMFLIFYIYAGIVAKIVDNHGGTSTEFLGDGVLNLFDTKEDGLDEALKRSARASWDIIAARELILNPFFINNGLPTIDLGIGIDHGITIVTKFGYRNDTDLKAFGRCVYNVSKLCKGMNMINASGDSQRIWPTAKPEERGDLSFGSPILIDGKLAYSVHKI